MASYISDTIFTAHFKYKSNSGGSGGNGGGTSGGGSGGPGQPVIPVLEIMEEEVPLGNLPKTGRHNRNPFVFLLSGAVFTAFAVFGKRKEEDE